jgi:hypothetical protein
MGNDQINYKDREDLRDKLILRKKDIPNSAGVIDNLIQSLDRVKRGDKKAMQEVIKMKKTMTDAQLETWMELSEDEYYDAVIKQKVVLDQIADPSKKVALDKSQEKTEESTDKSEKLPDDIMPIEG